MGMSLVRIYDYNESLKNIVRVLNGEEIANQEFAYSIKSFIEYIGFSITGKELICDIKGMPDDFLSTTTNSQISINYSIISNICNGNKEDFFLIFHYLVHIKRVSDIENGIISDDVIKIIMERCLNLYQRTNNGSSFYLSNYNVSYEETCVDLEGVKNTVAFFEKYHIKLTEKEINYLLKRQSIADENKKKLRRYGSNNKHFNDQYLSLEEAFKYAIKDNPMWYKIYPQLEQINIDDYCNIESFPIVKH